MPAQRTATVPAGVGYDAGCRRVAARASGVEFCSGNARGDGLPCGIADAGGEHVGASSRGAGEDLGDVLRRFSFRVDDLGDAEAQAAVMIDAGKARVFIGHGAEALKRRLRRERAGAHGFEQCEHVVSIH